MSIRNGGRRIHIFTYTPFIFPLYPFSMNVSLENVFTLNIAPYVRLSIKNIDNVSC